MLQYKDSKGNIVERTNYDLECGDIYYNNKKVGVFELESDSALGSYYHITLDNGKQFHDHYHDDNDIVSELLFPTV